MSHVRSQAGFSLIELLVAMIIGMATILAAFTLIDTTTTHSARVTARTDASQRGRIALDAMTRQLRSQVCVNGVAPILAATPNQITFTTDLTGTGASDLRTLTFDSTTRRLTQTVTLSNGLPEPGRLFTGATTATTLLADVVADTAQSVFTYWADKPGTGGSQLLPLAATVPITDLKRIARIDIAFVARPSGASTTSSWSSTLEDSITVRAIEANNADPTIACS
jgi:prepilin-type N-terminal cleavage/methylation domain-containing protein